MLYDPQHQPHLTKDWVFRALLGVAALMRSFGAALAMQTSGILLGLPLAPLALSLPMPRRLGENLLQALPDTIMALLISWGLLKYAHQAKLTDLGLEMHGRVWREGLLGVAGGMVILGLVVLPMFSLGEPQWKAVESRMGSVSGVLILVGLLGFAAFSEELILRGYAFQSLVYPLDLMGAVLVTSGAFAALHLGNRGANEITVANTFLAGCALGVLVAWRRSLWVATGAHLGWNLATILLGLNVSGITVPLMPFRLSWKGAEAWTGGDYGPEGSVVCTAVLLVLVLVLIRLYYQREEDEAAKTEV